MFTLCQNNETYAQALVRHFAISDRMAISYSDEKKISHRQLSPSQFSKENILPDFLYLVVFATAKRKPLQNCLIAALTDNPNNNDTWQDRIDEFTNQKGPYSRTYIKSSDNLIIKTYYKHKWSDSFYLVRLVTP